MADDAILVIAEPPQARFNRNRVTDRSKCSMYFLAGAGLIKIGITTNLTSRVRAIRNSSPVALELLAIAKGRGNVDEGILHSRFGHLRRHGEWFEDDGSIRAHIEWMVRSGQAETIEGAAA